MTDSYIGTDRRSVRTQCPLHEGMVEWVKDERESRKEGQKDLIDRLDKLLERQMTNHEEVQQIRSIVTNGLQTTVRDTANRLVTVCETLRVLEDFNWFRKPVTAFRDHAFLTFMKICLFGGGIYAVVHFSNKLIDKVVG